MVVLKYSRLSQAITRPSPHIARLRPRLITEGCITCVDVFCTQVPRSCRFVWRIGLHTLTHSHSPVDVDDDADDDDADDDDDEDEDDDV